MIEILKRTKDVIKEMGNEQLIVMIKMATDELFKRGDLRLKIEEEFIRRGV